MGLGHWATQLNRQFTVIKTANSTNFDCLALAKGQRERHPRTNQCAV
jgi:hypothetical protein